MVRAVLAGYVEPASQELEEEFNRWYDEIHIPQVIERIPGVIGGRRYRLSATQLVDGDSLILRRYLSLYEIDTEDLQGLADRIVGAMSDGTLDMSDALDTANLPPVMHFYDAL